MKRRRAPVGTTFKYRLSTAAAVKLTIARLRPSGKPGRRAGTLRRAGRTGANRTPFTGRIGKKALRPGRYRVTVVATADGRSSTPRRAKFTVVRR